MAKQIKPYSSAINVENLLRLKRFERPSEAFWNQFDRELHQRMLQTLVKKDPWYLQVMRGFSSSLLSGAAFALCAVVIGIFAVRTVFPPMPSQAATIMSFDVPAQVADAALPISIQADNLIGTLDYGTDAISVDDVSDEDTFRRDFGMQGMQVAAYDAAVYSTDSAHARISFVSTGLVY